MAILCKYEGLVWLYYVYVQGYVLRDYEWLVWLHYVYTSGGYGYIT